MYFWASAKNGKFYDFISVKEKLLSASGIFSKDALICKKMLLERSQILRWNFRLEQFYGIPKASPETRLIVNQICLMALVPQGQLLRALSNFPLQTQAINMYPVVVCGMCILSFTLWRRNTQIATRYAHKYRPQRQSSVQICWLYGV